MSTISKTTQEESCHLCQVKKCEHGSASQNARCFMCKEMHGTSVQRTDRDGKLQPRTVIVRHSLPLKRENDLWSMRPVCDDCAFGIRREVRARKGNVHPPEFYELGRSVTEATSRNEEERKANEASTLKEEKRKGAIEKFAQSWTGSNGKG